MDKVRFACPRCSTVMQTGADRVGSQVACPQCRHAFKLVDHPDSGAESAPQVDVDAPTLAPGQSHTSLVPEGYDTPPTKPHFAPSADYPSSGSGSAATGSWAPVGAAQPLYATGRENGHGFRCPYCGTTHPPVWRSEVSQLGWVIFAILLVTTCVFCFVGLFVRNRYRVCSQCRVRLE